MAVKPEYRDELKAFATGDIERAQALGDLSPDADRSDYHKLLGALFAVLLDHHFQGHPSVQAIADLVARMRRDYERAGQPFKAWRVEGVLRAVAGEEHLFDELDTEHVLSTQMIVVGRLPLYDPAVSADIDGFLDQAEALVGRWEQSERPPPAADPPPRP